MDFRWDHNGVPVITTAVNAESLIVDPSTDTIERSQPVSPGALRGEVWLTLQTHQAVILVHGRPPLGDKPAIIGLTGFADRLRILWDAARNDDPYADWWLLKIDAAIRAATDLIDSQQRAVEDQLNQFTAIAFDVAHSERPTRIGLRFANPYAYQAARLLAQFDRLMCLIVTATHGGVLRSDRRQQIQHACARKLRSLFMVPQTYRLMKLDRATVRAGTGRASEARQTMGELPEEILSGEHRAPFAPRNPLLTTAKNLPTASQLSHPVTVAHDES